MKSPKRKKQRKVVLGEGYARFRTGNCVQCQFIGLNTHPSCGDWKILNDENIWEKKIRLIAEVLE